MITRNWVITSLRHWVIGDTFLMESTTHTHYLTDQKALSRKPPLLETQISVLTDLALSQFRFTLGRESEHTSCGIRMLLQVAPGEISAMNALSAGPVAMNEQAKPQSSKKRVLHETGL